MLIIPVSRNNFLIGEHPVGKLRVPAEAMSTHLDAVLATEVGNFVGFFPVPDTLLGMYLAGFHVVLGGDGVELLFDESNLIGIRHIALVHSDANREEIFVGVLHATWHLWLAEAWALRVYICAAEQEHEQRQKGNVYSIHIRFTGFGVGDYNLLKNLGTKLRLFSQTHLF